MDCLINLALGSDFERVSVNHNGVLVFNCVPGAGKSTLIRKALRKDSRFVAFTFGKADPVGQRGRGILPAALFDSEATRGKLVLVDEYTEGDWRALGACAIFGDPQQASVNRLWPEPNFVCLLSKRFGAQTAALLRNLGHEVYSEKEDFVEWSGVFQGEPRGLVLAYEPEVIELIEDHHLDYRHPNCCRGITVEHVTFITSLDHFDVNRPDLQYLCLTRHSKSLLILSPNATLGTA
jgi:hypothetical protein